MNRIDKKFQKLKQKKKSAFIPYICFGDPQPAITETLIKSLESSGADIIELGVPFSDPLADGPTIQRASQRALKRDVSLKKILEFVKRVRKFTQIPIILMGYYNPILYYGLTSFVKDAVAAGVDGAIIPDLPIEEAREFIDLSRKSKLSTIFLASPTSPPKKMKIIAQKSTGFVYYVSLTGVTGTRSELPKEVKADVKRLKSYTKKPVCVGFGISTKEQARQISKFADGYIIGSAIIKRIEANLGSKNKIINSVERVAKSFRV